MAAMVRALFILLAIVIATSPARAADRYAAFVADMETGEVLHARQADAARYPASLTKMMTLYMLFEAIEAGEVALDDEITASAEAASRPASKLGLDAGDTIGVEEAIRALIIESANDVAVAVAEHLADNETAFAAQMTARARTLGLEATTFRNASGLPDRGQRTTARDMARLAYALRRDFPERFHYFSETRFRWDGVTHRSHNTLVGRVDGVTGLKTGYIRASGFNIAVTAERADQSLIAVVMGGRTAAVRDAHATELVEAAFTSLEARRDGLVLAARQAPRLNPIREQEILTAELSDVDAPRAMGSAAGAPAVSVVVDDAEPTLDLAPLWSVQVGAFGSRSAAEERLNAVARMPLADLAPLNAAEPVAEPVARGGRTLWRARFSGVGPDAARRICARLASVGESCFAVSPHA
ncbi:D-alanyl-D-alanine carboxypeptidase [Marinicauda salina]|uniref:D-alanyl-D-alanine carboxypeptidase n=1 Tax=Marinicauda salina TaxID=2135793 RepID=A0A2U2BRN1_9PROT|nr:D-alanyl-D-alanine carboxypeptidase [Marinicauda salina]